MEIGRILTNFNTAEIKTIKKCIDHQGVRSNFKHFLYRLANAIKGIFGHSDRQQATKILHLHSSEIIHSFLGEEIKKTYDLSQFTDFVINYFSTEAAWNNGRLRFYLPQTTWNKSQEIQINDESEFILFSLYGSNETTKENLQVKVLELINKETDAFKAILDEAKKQLIPQNAPLPPNDPPTVLKEKIEGERVTSQNPEEAIPKNDFSGELDKQIRSLIEIKEKYIEDLDKLIETEINSHDASKTLTELVDILKKLRQEAHSFQTAVKRQEESRVEEMLSKNTNVI